MKVKPKRTFGWFLENGMFYLFLIVLVINLLVSGVDPIIRIIDNGGFNKTVGWMWELTNVNNLKPIFFTFFLFGFFLLLVLNKKTNRKLSLIFLIAIVIILFYDFMPYGNYAIVYYFKLFTFVMYIIIFFQALFRKQNLK